jgi:hypothetical protein
MRVRQMRITVPRAASADQSRVAHSEAPKSPKVSDVSQK